MLGKVFFENLNNALEKYLVLPDRSIVSVRLVSDQQMKKLNRLGRGQDYPTDVLAWSFVSEPLAGPEKWLGEIIINYQQANRQARDLGHSLRTELAWLYLHGLLHILGYDHKNSSQQQQMIKLTEEILRQAGF